MFGLGFKSEVNAKKVADKAKAGSFRSLGHAAASIRLVAKRLFRKGRGASAAGEPPHTHRGTLPEAILFDVDQQAESAIVGTAASLAGESGSPHEHGGEYKGDLFEERPFMMPALLKVKDRLPEHWANSIQ